MRHTEIDELECSVARSWQVLGERWTMLVLRECFNRTRRFDDFQSHLGIARNVLTDRLPPPRPEGTLPGRPPGGTARTVRPDRLAPLVEEGILEPRQYQEPPPRYEYRLTEKGLDLYPVL